MGLGLKTITIDIGKSDQAAFQAAEQQTRAKAVPTEPSLAQETGAGPTIPPVAPSAEKGMAADSTVPVTPPPATMAEYATTLKKAEHTFKQALADSSRIMKQICSGSEEGFKTADRMVSDLSSLVQSEYDTSAMVSMLNLEELPETSALHALNVCALSMMVGKQFDLPAAQIKALGLGGLFHDAGEDRIPPAIMRKLGRLNATQQRQWEEHPKHGVQIASQIREIPHDALEIIREHHERLDGSGFPFGLKGDRISQLSQIVMVVDEYDALINPREATDALSPTEALSELYVKRRGALSHDAVVGLVQTLSVYPPGSIVQLSDSALGLVVSTNFANRMRPMVLLYAPNSPPDRPLVVNLAETSGISIDQLIPKQDLRPEVAHYLSLKRWIGYFIHASLKTAKEQEINLSAAA